jgi:hypothetical protein
VRYVLVSRKSNRTFDFIPNCLPEGKHKPIAICNHIFDKPFLHGDMPMGRDVLFPLKRKWYSGDAVAAKTRMKRDQLGVNLTNRNMCIVMIILKRYLSEGRVV